MIELPSVASDDAVAVAPHATVTTTGHDSALIPNITANRSSHKGIRVSRERGSEQK